MLKKFARYYVDVVLGRIIVAILISIIFSLGPVLFLPFPWSIAAILTYLVAHTTLFEVYFRDKWGHGFLFHKW